MIKFLFTLFMIAAVVFAGLIVADIIGAALGLYCQTLFCL